MMPDEGMISFSIRNRLEKLVNKSYVAVQFANVSENDAFLMGLSLSTVSVGTRTSETVTSRFMREKSRSHKDLSRPSVAVSRGDRSVFHVQDLHEPVHRLRYPFNFFASSAYNFDQLIILSIKTYLG